LCGAICRSKRYVVGGRKLGLKANLVKIIASVVSGAYAKVRFELAEPSKGPKR
jgi:hypothetical protein